MAVGLQPPEKPCGPAGIRLAAVSAGIYRKPRNDLALIELEGGGCSSVFTTNAFAAAPVVIARKHGKQAQARYCIINAGNANAGNGEAGLDAAMQVCGRLSELTGCRPEEILPFSTGVIGEPYPADKVVNALPELIGRLEQDNWLEVARAIMTTDTVPKAVSRKITLDGCPVTVTGIAKGAGMIRPDMATMLAFIGTDARIANSQRDRILAEAVECSFNRICIDGDTSTNDACVLMSSGSAPNPEITGSGSAGYGEFREAVIAVAVELAQAIVRDGEGASKFITVTVEGGNSSAECLQVAYAVATSPLVKTAFFASDPNWGRILAAVGRAGLDDLDIGGVSLYLNEVLIAGNGERDPDYTERSGLEAMSGEEITVRILLNRGECRETVWTCDLSHEYVQINAEYRT